MNGLTNTLNKHFNGRTTVTAAVARVVMSEDKIADSSGAHQVDASLARQIFYANLARNQAVMQAEDEAALRWRS